MHDNADSVKPPVPSVPVGATIRDKAAQAALKALRDGLILPVPAKDRDADEETYTRADVSEAYKRGLADAR